jgi:alkylated DNA repair dioxygenase AlkB
VSSNLQLFADLPAAAAEPMPAGLRYRPELISAARQADLLRRIQELDLRPFEFHGYQGLRRTHSFGYRYDYTRRTVLGADPMPDFLQALRSDAAAFAARSPEEFCQALVTEYAPGAPIGWHRDKPEFGIVVGVSLLSACALRFRRRRSDGKWDRRALQLQPRSAYLLSGESRVVWEHSIAPMAARRYSVTFRTLVRERIGAAPCGGGPVESPRSARQTARS